MKKSEENHQVNMNSDPDPEKIIPVDVQDSLIGQLKDADSRDRKSLVFTLIISGLFIMIYGTSIARNSGVMLMGYQFLAGGFVLIFLYILIRYFQHKKIDYSEPVILFLQKAEKRYRYFRFSEVIIAIPLLIFIGTGGGLIVYDSFKKYFPGSYIPIALYLLIFISAVSVGLWASRRKWVNEKKRILNNIRLVLSEFGE
jgi:hypothetical protein